MLKFNVRSVLSISLLLPTFFFVGCGTNNPNNDNLSTNAQYLAGLSPQLACLTGPIVGGSNLAMEISFGDANALPVDPTAVNYTLIPGGYAALSSSVNPYHVILNTPPAANVQEVFNVTAQIGANAASQAFCSVTLEAANQFIVDTGFNGPSGNVYLTSQLPAQYDDNGHVYALPPLAALQSLSPALAIAVPEFYYGARSLTSPFPTLTGLQSWYAIVFNATLAIPADGNYQIEVCSQGASQTFYDGNLVVDLNDHHYGGPLCRDSAPMQRIAGQTKFTLMYLQDQGPTFQLEVKERKLDAAGNPITNYDYIPAARFTRDVPTPN